MKSLSTFPTPLALALYAALFAPTAMAAPTLGATTSAESPIGSAAVPGTFTSPGYVNSSSSIFSGVGNANAYTFANASGAYAVSTSATGMGQSSGQASLSETFTNLSGQAQSYFLTLKIYGGSIGSFLNGSATLDAGEYLTASYKAEVKIGSAVKFASAATITRSGDTGTIGASHTGTRLSGSDDANNAADIADGYYNWSLGFYNIDLGVVAAGESITVDALLDGASIANVGTYDFGGGGGGYGGCNIFTEGNTALVEGGCFKGTANEFYGDPAALNVNDLDAQQQAFGQFSITAGRIPEPAPLALAGVALVAGAVARRRRENKDKG